MVLANVTGTEKVQDLSTKNKTVSKGIEETIVVNLVASNLFSPVDEREEVEEDTIPELDLGDSVTTSDTEPEVLPFVPASDTEPEVLPFVPTSDTEPEVLLFVPASDTEPEVLPSVPASDTEPKVLPSVPASDTEPEVLLFVPASDTEPEVLPFVPASDTEPEVLPFVPASDTEPEVLPFVPASDTEPKVLPFVPALDTEPKVLPFVPASNTEPKVLPFVPTIRSGSFADIGPRRHMEDEHICIDDLSSHMGSLFTFPTPSAFYGVFDGHGGSDAAAYVKRHAMRFFFEESVFPQASDADNVFIESVECSIRKAFSLADHALADDCTISSSSGTTALAAWVFGRLLLVANAGDCRAVLCRKGEAINMSHDHRPGYTSECERIKSCGGYIDDGYLNGVLSVSRALGDWDMKLPRGSSSALISEPEFTQTLLTEEDEFLIIGCDGIWDVMSSQHAVSIVRRGLRRHDNPEQCARELVREALRLNTFDNLTVVVVCFTRDIRDERKEKEVKLRCCSLSAEALCNLKSWLDN